MSSRVDIFLFSFVFVCLDFFYSKRIDGGAYKASRSVARCGNLTRGIHIVAVRACPIPSRVVFRSTRGKMEARASKHEVSTTWH